MEFLKRMATSCPNVFSDLLEWYDNETDGGLECYRLRNMEDFNSTFEGLTQSELTEMQGYHFDKNDKYFYTDEHGNILSINEKNYSTIINNHPYILTNLFEWLNETA